MMGFDTMRRSLPSTTRSKAASARLPGRTKAETKMFVSKTTLTP